MHEPHIAWAINALSTQGYQMSAVTPEIIQDTPWSTVYRFNTNQGFIFLKKVPACLSIEATVINVLCNKFHASVPQVIAHHDELHCFLMHDAGISLYEYFKENFQADILIKTLQKYSMLQISIANKVQIFLDMGLPDWRLTKLPSLYQDLISQESFLRDGGLTLDEITILKKLTPKFFSICEQLSHYNIQDTFGHADFHDKNILIDTKTHQTTLIDLGEVVITHPFFSLHNCIHRITEHFLLSDSEYRHLQIACFKPWLTLETEEHLIEVLSLIQQCWSIHAVLGEYRLVQSIDPASRDILYKQNRVARKFKFWINHS